MGARGIVVGGNVVAPGGIDGITPGSGVVAASPPGVSGPIVLGGTDVHEASPTKIDASKLKRINDMGAFCNVANLCGSGFRIMSTDLYRMVDDVFRPKAANNPAEK
tara:strand:+ start:1456 stop:1773 length:318 start_codon:yes stop_codon:yes gene_type:complete